MRILYHQPSSTIYAGRTIFYGYKNAFEDLGHDFSVLSADDNLGKVLHDFCPDIFFTALNNYNLRFLDLALIKKQRAMGMKVFVNIPFWRSPMSRLRVNECSSLSGNIEHLNLIRSCDLGDFYYNSVEQGDARMDGFQEATGISYHTIPLAADKTIMKFSFSERFVSDIAYIGTYLPEKRHFFKEYVLPLNKHYDLCIYGQDWSRSERILSFAQKVGQYFNIRGLRTIIKPKLALSDEASIYSSTKISINIHEDYQKKYGGECNERTFKIPLCGGFEITDDVAAIRKYFTDDEIVVARNKTDWFDKIDFYMKNPDKRIKIAEKGRIKVMSDHTYHNRVEQILKIYRNGI